MLPNRSSVAGSRPIRPHAARSAGLPTASDMGPYATQELEELRLLDGTPGSPAIRVLPDPKPREAAPKLRAADPKPRATEALYARARLLWPGLDSRALSRCGGDPRRVARLVARRTVLTEEAIVELLLKR